MKSVLLGIYLSFGADAAITHHAISNRSAVEVALPTQSPWAIDGIIAGEAALTSLGINYLDKHKHPKAARIIGIVIIGARSSVVVHNIMELRK